MPSATPDGDEAMPARASESPAEVMLRRWAARKLGVGVAEVLSVSFTHEEAWANDSGTAWPEENTAVVTLTSRAKGPQKREFDVQGVAEFPALLAEILAEPDVSGPQGTR